MRLSVRWCCNIQLTAVVVGGAGGVRWSQPQFPQLQLTPNFHCQLCSGCKAGAKLAALLGLQNKM